MDLMLKAADAETMMAKLIVLGLADDEGNSVTRVSFAEPFIWDTKPVYDDEGNVTTEGVASAEYHLNVRDLAGVITDPTPAVYDEDEVLVSGTDWGDVTWVDPADVATPALVWS